MYVCMYVCMCVCMCQGRDCLKVGPPHLPPFFPLSVGPNSGLCKEWVRRIRGEFLGGCLMKAVILNDTHPIYTLHPP